MVILLTNLLTSPTRNREPTRSNQIDLFLVIVKAHLLAVMSDLDRIRADIEITKADLAEAKRAGDRELILAFSTTLAKQQEKENILLASSAG
ncbi:hypothetical protein EON65_55990 [archaeon]|nr:MAG: hypothetical protein EON65_55990 [archaeon]